MVFGASGDLARKKTFPALFGLFREGYLSDTTRIIGYARTKMTVEEFHSRIKEHFDIRDGSQDLVGRFLDMCTYESAQYDQPEGYKKLTVGIEEFEASRCVDRPHRLFYLALPPAVFIPVAERVRKYCHPGKME